MKHSPDASVPKNISEPLVQANKKLSSSENDTDLEGVSNEPTCFSQNELDDLVRDLNLSKQAAKLLASRLKEKKLLSPGKY